MRKKHSVVRASSMSRRRRAVKANGFANTWANDIFRKGLPSGVKEIIVYFRDGRSAKYTSRLFNEFISDSAVNQILDSETGEILFDRASGVGASKKSVKCSTRRRRSVKAASARRSIKASDPIDSKFMVDLFYSPNGRRAGDRYFYDWSEAESYAHDALMKGLYVKIWNMENGDILEISPDEYQDAFDGDFDINEDIVRFKRGIISSKSVQCSSRRRIRAAADGGVMLKTETAEGTYYLAKSATKKKTFWTESYDSANKFAKKDSALNKLYSVLGRLEDNAFYDADDMYDIEDEADLKKAKFAKFYITDLSGKTIEDISTEVKNHMLADDEFVSAVLGDIDDEDDIEESTKIRGRRTIKASKDHPYLYVLKHGLGPGTLPRDVEIIKTDEYNGYTLVWLDRSLTTSELKEYDIPSESNIERYLGEDFDRFNGVFSSRKVGRYIKASAYDGGDIVMFYNGKEIYRGQPGSYMYDAIYDLCKNDSVRMKFQEWLEQYGDSAFSDEPGYEYGDAGETAVEFCEFVYYAFADGEDYLDGEGILNFEIFPESDEAELFGDYKYGDIESSTVLSARDNTVDKDAVRELVLYITNDASLYPQVQSIVKNMQQKIKRGKYDAELAVKAWQYLADAGVAKYDKEFGSGGGTKAMLNKATREQIARELRDEYEDMVNEGVEASEGLVTM